MGLDEGRRPLYGLALGAWGAVQATCAGAAIALRRRAARRWSRRWPTHGWLGEALQAPATGYSFVYHLELTCCSRR